MGSGPASRCPGHQTRALKHTLGPRVTQGETVTVTQVVVEVLHRPAHVAGPVLLQHPLDPIHGDPPRRRLAEPAVEQTVEAFGLIAASVAVKAALAHPQQLHRVVRRQTLRIEALQHIAKLLHPALL